RVLFRSPSVVGGSRRLGVRGVGRGGGDRRKGESSRGDLRRRGGGSRGPSRPLLAGPPSGRRAGRRGLRPEPEVVPRWRGSDSGGGRSLGRCRPTPARPGPTHRGRT